MSQRSAKRISRRTLITAAATVPVASVRGAAANSAVRVGLIGAGGRGTKLASHLVKDPRARLVAVCDLFDEKLEQAKTKIPVENPRLYKDLDKLLASDVDAVIIATPVYLHPEHLEAAVRAGKHIYIEKPAAADVAGCKRVMRAADSAGPKLNITFGFQQRYGPNYQAAKRLVDSGGIGKIRQAHAHFLKGPVTGKEPILPKPQTELEKVRHWKQWRELYGDIIVETYCHSIDVLNWFFGDQHPSKAHGTGGRTIRKAGDMMDHLTVVFDYEDSVQATMFGSHITPPFFREVFERFFGETGAVETAREYWKHYRDRRDVIVQKPSRRIEIDAIEEFVGRVRDGRPENVGVRGAVSTLTAILGRMSIDLRREVTWDEMMRSEA